MSDRGQDTDYEFIEIKVSRKIDVRLSLDDLISAVQQHANELAASKERVEAEVSDRLNQLNQLADQLKNELGQIGRSG
jgi:hypothetical protein